MWNKNSVIGKNIFRGGHFPLAFLKKA